METKNSTNRKTAVRDETQYKTKNSQYNTKNSQYRTKNSTKSGRKFRDRLVLILLYEQFLYFRPY